MPAPNRFRYLGYPIIILLGIIFWQHVGLWTIILTPVFSSILLAILFALGATKEEFEAKFPPKKDDETNEEDEI